jgi:hypothetical protein
MADRSRLSLTRRELLAASAGVALAALDGTAPAFGASLQPGVRPGPVGPGRLKQSVCRWPYRTIPLPQF